MPDKEMPADPWAAIEESNLQRDIAAIDRKKEQEGITWAQYLGTTLVLFGMTPYFKYSSLRNRVNDIGMSGLVMRVSEAEDLDSPDFPEVKREVVKAIGDVLTLQRELMQSELKEEAYE